MSMIPYLNGCLIDPNRKPLLALSGPEPGWDCVRQINDGWIRRETDNQGQRPLCVIWTWSNVWQAYTIVNGMAFGTDFDYETAYANAKQRDGMPSQDGTTLEAGWEASVDEGYFPAWTQTLELPAGDETLFKWAIVRAGVIAGASHITEGWRHATPYGDIPDSTIFIGYHATMFYGFDKAYVYGFNTWDKFGECIDGIWGHFRLTWAQWHQQFQYGMIVYNEAREP